MLANIVLYGVDMYRCIYV